MKIIKTRLKFDSSHHHGMKNCHRKSRRDHLHPEKSFKSINWYKARQEKPSPFQNNLFFTFKVIQINETCNVHPNNAKT